MKKQFKFYTLWTWIAYFLGGILVTATTYGAIGTLLSTTAANWLCVMPIGFAAAYSAFRMRNSENKPKEEQTLKSPTGENEWVSQSGGAVQSGNSWHKPSVLCG